MEEALKLKDEDEEIEEEEVVYDLLMGEWEEKCEKLIEEENLLQIELEKLEVQRGNSAVNEAKIAVLSREAETLLAMNDVAGSEKKMVEVDKIKRHQMEVISSISQKASRLEAIGVEKTRIANEVLNSLYPEIQSQCLAEEEALITFLETVLDDMNEFASQTGATVRLNHREGLTPAPLGKTRALKGRFDEFFS